MADTSSDVGARYRRESARAAAERDRQSGRSRLVSYARLAAFAAAALCLLSAASSGGGPVRVTAGAACLLVFFGLVWFHSRIEARERWSTVEARAYEEAAARVARDWNRLTPSPLTGPGATHAYADDLDLFGHASLTQLLGWVGTEAGRQTLAGWLVRPAAPDIVIARQQAVAELAPQVALREEFATLARLVEPTRRDLEGFFRWAEEGPWLARKRWLSWTVRVVPVLTLGALAAQVAGLTDRPWWLYPLAVALALAGLYGRRINDTFQRAFSRDHLLQQHSALFARIAGARVAAPFLRAIQDTLGRSGLTAAREMGEFARIEEFASLRFVQLFHFVIDVLTLWDFQVLRRLERWQARTAGALRGWFDALGEFDALAAMAALSCENPGWAFPEIARGGDRIAARQLGHPLIAADRRVPNDVEIGPPGSFLLVTGSNMSGKSTLLRAVGTNVVLALAGAPVCATRMTLPPLALCTSMRVSDSLEDGVSYFMAALQRLKVVVSAARAVGSDSPMLLYLLDEVLQGTNTAERQVAVRRILRHLLSMRTLGAVTTHDLELAACDELVAACRPVHFTEGIEVSEAAEGTGGGPGQPVVRLSFDYTLKPGVATSQNALKLLQTVGLDV